MAATDKVYKEWFILADADKDGFIGGGEAVQFFQRSGLAQDTLGQVWELASGGQPKLNQAQFSNALRLVALAQNSSGRLPLDQARVVLAGLGPAMPVPRMHGMEQFGGPSYSPQVTGAMQPPAAVGYAAQHTGMQQATYGAVGYTPQYTGAQPQPGMVPGYAPQVTGAAPGHMAPGYAPQVTGAAPGHMAPGYVAQPTGGVLAPPAAAPAAQLPPATPADIQRYQSMFTQLDADKDGLVQGAECFGFFMQWGLDKSVLRDIWSVVAGAAGALTGQQFVQSLYLMDCAKKGIRPPVTLPPGPFPPVAQQWSLASQFGGASAAASTAAHQTSQQAVLPPPVPPVPPKYEPPAADTFTAPAHASQVPAINGAAMATFTADEKSKLSRELTEAEGRESKLHAAEDDAARTKARLAAFNAALQEVTVFKSRTDVALLQAQDAVVRLEAELEATTKKYDTAYAAAQSQGESARKLRDHLSRLLADKAEAEGKLAALEAETAAANSLTPADVARMEAEVAQLTAAVAQAEAARDARAGALAALRSQREGLQAKLEGARGAARDAEAEADAARREIADIASQVAAVRAGASSAAGGEALLSRCAQAYRRLYAFVSQAGGGAVPADALPGNLGLAGWLDDVLEGAADWQDVSDDARGYVLVNALPGQSMPRQAQSAAAAKPTAAPAAVQQQPAAAAGAAAAGGVGAFGEVDAFGEAPAFGASGGGSAHAAPAPAAANAFPAADAFGEAPAAWSGGGAAAPAAAAAAASTAPAAPSLPGAFGFDDAPAFGAAPAPAAPKAAPVPMSAFAAPAAAPMAAAAAFASASGGGAAAAFGDPSPFGDDAFGGSSAGGAPAAPQQQQPAAAPAAAGFGFDDNAFA